MSYDFASRHKPDVLSIVNVFPRIPRRIQPPAPITVPLSIIDNTVANFSRCAAVWYFNASAVEKDHFPSIPLQASLSETLNYYRPWCGRLSYSKPNFEGTHTDRYQRISITYDTPDDIGVQFITAISPLELCAFMPDTSQRAESMKAWNPSDVSSNHFLPDTKLAISTDPNAPNVIIQVTEFACGGMAITIQITHCLADAVCLARFAKDWSHVSRSMLSRSEIPKLSLIFAPQLLDSFASRDIDAKEPDLKIQNKARALPQHRYDWYKQGPTQTRKPNIPSDLDPTWELSPSDPIPWEQWDSKAPVSQRVLHFSSTELQNIYRIASSSSPSKISKHDALLAHVWTRINIARQLPSGTKTCLDMTLGLRARVNPPLADSFLGSPITHAAIPFPSLSPSSPSSATLGEVASQIRTTLSQFTPQAIGALLHDTAFEVAPQRLWRACLGREHVLLTTWVHSGVHEVDFTGEGRGGLRYVEAIMPSGCDGLVVVMEGLGMGEREEGGSWSEGGVDVTIFLEVEAIERLVADQGLWGGGS